MLKRGGLAIASAALLLVGVALVWLLGASPLALLYRSPQIPPITQLVPAAATSFVAVRAPFAQLEALHLLSHPSQKRHEARSHWRAFWHGHYGSPMAAALTSLDFERDIEPWLGDELLVAMLPEQAQPTPLIALATRNLEKSNRLLNWLVESLILAQTPPVIDLYKGVQIFHDPASPWSAAAFGDRYVVFGGSPEAIKTAIDDWQSPSLRQHHDLIPGRVGVAYAELETGVFTAGLDASFQGLVANFRWQRPETTTPVPDDLLAQLPEDTLAFATDHQPLTSWLGLPLESLDPWLRDRYVVALLPDNHWLVVQPTSPTTPLQPLATNAAGTKGGYTFIADSAATLAHAWQDTPLTVRSPWRRLSALLPKAPEAYIDLAGELMPNWPVDRFTAAFRADTGRAILRF